MKTIILTSIIPAAKIEDKFLKSLNLYCKKHRAELNILELKDNYKGDSLDEQYQSFKETYKSSFVNIDKVLNKNLNISVFKQSINIFDPLSGLERLVTYKKKSCIFGYPRQRAKMVPRMLKNSKTPLGMWCTGTISKPYYKETKAGELVKNYHTLGALVIEIENSEIFHIRQIQWDGTGFYDIKDGEINYYTSEKISKIDHIEAISLGDDHATFLNTNIVKKTKKLIQMLKPKYVFHHDSFDSNSISHHLQNKQLTQAQLFINGLTLDSELKLTSNYLQDMINNSKTSKHILVASNHLEHLDRYLEEVRYDNDKVNHIIALELALSKAKGENCLLYGLKKFNKLERFHIASRKDTLKIRGIEMLNHGDYGSNGSRGNERDCGLVYSGDVISGHSHSPSIGVFGNFVNGTMTDLDLPYTNSSAGSSWMWCHTIVYPNGKRTQLMVV